jgi:hypothetical protein
LAGLHYYDQSIHVDCFAGGEDGGDGQQRESCIVGNQTSLMTAAELAIHLPALVREKTDKPVAWTNLLQKRDPPLDIRVVGGGATFRRRRDYLFEVRIFCTRMS